MWLFAIVGGVCVDVGLMLYAWLFAIVGGVHVYVECVFVGWECGCVRLCVWVGVCVWCI